MVRGGRRGVKPCDGNMSSFRQVSPNTIGWGLGGGRREIEQAPFKSNNFEVPMALLCHFYCFQSQFESVQCFRNNINDNKEFLYYKRGDRD